MNKPFKTLQKKMSASAQKKIVNKTQQMLQNLPIQESHHGNQIIKKAICDTIHQNSKMSFSL